MADLTSTSFFCQLCGALATTLTLTTSTALSPAAPTPTLQLAGFWGAVTEQIGPEDWVGLHAAIAQQNALAIYQLNSLWLPCYCPECDRVYCRAHWRITPQFDDDFPGWYDCAYGVCPHEHRRLVDD
jgi:hypothetical protein